MKLRTVAKILLPALLLAAAVEAILPATTFTQPVLGASRSDWNPQTFWLSPWGKSGGALLP